MLLTMLYLSGFEVYSRWVSLTIEPRRHGGGNPTNLTQGDLQLIN